MSFWSNLWSDLFWVVPLVGIVTLLVVWSYYRQIKKADPGNEKMQEISHAIRTGAFAFIRREYTSVAWVLLIALPIIYFTLDLPTLVTFLIGAFLSLLAGFIGMNAATLANVRTAQAAKNGTVAALQIAFPAGAIMGLTVVGLNLVGISVLYLLFGEPELLTGYGLGSSLVALFARFGGGIYTKAADVGADLVGKLEEGIPEDDPRNPAVIADNVGDNVGDVCGMGSDLFESEAEVMVAAMSLGATLTARYGAKAIVGPVLLFAIGVLASVLGVYFIRMRKNSNVYSAINNGNYVTCALAVLGGFFFTKFYLNDLSLFGAVMVGPIAGLLVGLASEYYTSDEKQPVRALAAAAQTGTATTIIDGVAIGMKSTVLPILITAGAVLIAHRFGGFFGLALSAVSMLSISGITIAVDAYGPVADNAGGITEMAGLPEEVREVTDTLDSVGNSMAAVTKGFDISAAALTALSLFAAYASAAQLEAIDLLSPSVIIGLFIGGIMPFFFSAQALEAVGRAAGFMIEEVRRQMREIPGLREGKAKPDYARCVDISTRVALKEMTLPSVIALLAPVVVGFALGKEALAGVLGGSLLTGMLMALFLANSGGAWDNAKKYIEAGNFGGKKSPAHEAAVIGDTVGDPFKDTAGPSLNILFKLVEIVALTIAPLIR
ncbi:sodium-translocating pyrophosphatase [Capillibacterium thermochitinicola]|uniref:sodium-translocating pyrophosphatase n=1 Tax=Capillibacterium thermochitinicola TaxID=2699427 RepID=UPI0038B2C199